MVEAIALLLGFWAILVLTAIKNELKIIADWIDLEQRNKRNRIEREESRKE